MPARGVKVSMMMPSTTISQYEHGRHTVPRYIKLAMMALWHRLEDPL